MAAISFPLAAVFQETTGGTPAQQAVTFTTPINPNQAQGAPAPQDTVTLTGQASQGQQAQQNPQQPQAFQGTVLVVAEAQVQVFAQGNAGANNAQQTPEGQPTAQVPTPTQTQNTAVGLAARNAANGGNAPAGATSSQQELQQLDQTLQQLGINPQSISLFNRLALLLYANDPAALQQFVQQLQQGAQDVGEGNALASSPATLSAAQPQNTTSAQNAGGTGGPGGASAAGASPATANPTPAQAQNTQAQNTLASSIFVQFEELQISFGNNGAQTQSYSSGGANYSGSNSNQSTQLNVTV
jgi:hypothetical protein